MWPQGMTRGELVGREGEKLPGPNCEGLPGHDKDGFYCRGDGEPMEGGTQQMLYLMEIFF